MSNKKTSQLERMARAYVEHCGDIPKAVRVVAPAMEHCSDSELLTHFRKTYQNLPAFQILVQEFREGVKDRIAVNASDLLMYWTQQQTADVSELMQVVTVPCHACWKDWQGGPIRPKLTNPACPICDGRGQKIVNITDTANLSPQAKLLFRGAEMTKYGVKIHVADPDEAGDKIAKAAGMFTTQLQITNAQAPKDAPEIPEDQNAASLTYAQWVKDT